ncbi:MAG: hypothetical protein II844_02845 [Prevotella sp.]|nr:hypothetical protein [Prevotella sp.]
MKLYIPTSTLNFNNILSSESISPKAFYSIRGFGYSRWTEVEENDNDNAIMLYSAPFSFVRPLSDLEDHPMLVEITTNESFPQVTEGVFYCDHTIYLSPWRTRFIFFNSQDKVVALSLSDSSLETKMLTLYRQRLFIQDYPIGYDKEIRVDIPLNTKAVESDFRINRLKGFLYGYYIGTLLSNIPEITKQANILQELRNIFSSVLSSESRTPTILQQEKLTTLFNELQKNDPVVLYLQDVIVSTVNVEKVISDLMRLDVSFPFKMNNKESIIHSLEYATDDNNYAIEWLKKEEQKLEQTEQKNRNPLLPSAEEVVVVDSSLSKIANGSLRDEVEGTLVKVWCNDVLTSKSYNGKVSTFAELLSDDITRKAKAVYGDSWDDSYAKTELNQMRRYVRGQEANVSWKDNVFSSIAAVIAKGSDWEQLRKFMQGKSMSDYKLAFAFYGELNGFANLTRDFTDILFASDDRKYIAEVYKEIYGQLLGEDPTQRIPDEDSCVISDPIEIDNGKDDITLKTQVYDKLKGIDIKPEISERIELTLQETNDGHEFIERLSERINKNTKVYKKLKDALHPYFSNAKQTRRTKKQKEKKAEPTLFPVEKDIISEAKGYSVKQYFYSDNKAWEQIIDDIPEKLRKSFHEDLVWFQEEYMKGERSKYYAKANRDNYSVINALARFLEKKHYDKVIIEKITQKLHRIYG